jgi:hypothetical protein
VRFTLFYKENQNRKPAAGRNQRANPPSLPL